MRILGMWSLVLNKRIHIECEMLLLQCEYFIPSKKWCMINRVVKSCSFKQVIWIPLSDFTLTQVSRSLRKTSIGSKFVLKNLWYFPLTSASDRGFMLLEKGMCFHRKTCFPLWKVSTALASPTIRNPPSWREKTKVPKTQEAQKNRKFQRPLCQEHYGVLCNPTGRAWWGMQLLWSSVLSDMGFLVMQGPLRFPFPGK